jgi:hypothetical protein
MALILFFHDWQNGSPAFDGPNWSDSQRNERCNVAQTSIFLYIMLTWFVPKPTLDGEASRSEYPAASSRAKALKIGAHLGYFQIDVAAGKARSAGYRNYPRK